ncbi:MAG TPA: DUF6763 family protein [Gammaproteobacteria bacterium]|nr:DUF6763 family protein [Gammaproteobacteria bacterium]
MATNTAPLPGRFYRDAGRDEDIEVLGIDEEDGLIEVQYADGDIEMVEPETWAGFDLALLESPDDRRPHHPD